MQKDKNQQHGQDKQFDQKNAGNQKQNQQSNPKHSQGSSHGAQHHDNQHGSSHNINKNAGHHDASQKNPQGRDEKEHGHDQKKTPFNR